MTDQGVLPDIEIPWTPSHFERDVDLDKCLELIRQGMLNKTGFQSEKLIKEKNPLVRRINV